ncbi:hypothetical protein D3C79_286700 [compost metagenome]
MAKVGIVFTDTPDGGFDFDFLMLEGEHAEQTPAIVNAELAGRLFMQFIKKQNAVVTEESGILAQH